MNSFDFVGRIATDITYENSKINCVRFLVAIPRRWSKMPDQRKKADFITCKAFHSVGEFIKTYFNVGQEIACDAHICSETILDCNGNTIVSTYALISSVDIIGNREHNEKYKPKDVEKTDFLEFLNGGSDDF